LTKIFPSQTLILPAGNFNEIKVRRLSISPEVLLTIPTTTLASLRRGNHTYQASPPDRPTWARQRRSCLASTTYQWHPCTHAGSGYMRTSWVILASVCMHIALAGLDSPTSVCLIKPWMLCLPSAIHLRRHRQDTTGTRDSLPQSNPNIAWYAGVYQTLALPR